jgi:hypothetical protein
MSFWFDQVKPHLYLDTRFKSESTNIYGLVCKKEEEIKKRNYPSRSYPTLAPILIFCTAALWSLASSSIRSSLTRPHPLSSLFRLWCARPWSLLRLDQAAPSHGVPRALLPCSSQAPSTSLHDHLPPRLAHGRASLAPAARRRAGLKLHRAAVLISISHGARPQLGFCPCSPVGRASPSCSSVGHRRAGPSCHLLSPSVVPPRLELPARFQGLAHVLGSASTMSSSSPHLHGALVTQQLVLVAVAAP